MALCMGLRAGIRTGLLGGPRSSADSGQSLSSTRSADHSCMSVVDTALDLGRPRPPRGDLSSSPRFTMPCRAAHAETAPICDTSPSAAPPLPVAQRRDADVHGAPQRRVRRLAFSLLKDMWKGVLGASDPPFQQSCVAWSFRDFYTRTDALQISTIAALNWAHMYGFLYGLALGTVMGLRMVLSMVIRMRIIVV